MGNKNKTISFRVSESAFGKLQDIADARDMSLSAVFRDYVDRLVAHDGRIDVVPTDEAPEEGGEPSDAGEFPPTVEVPKRFVRENERLELEAEHLRDALEEHKEYIRRLETALAETQQETLEELAEERAELDSPADTYRIG
jgi:predicted transcriptional regulator